MGGVEMAYQLVGLSGSVQGMVFPLDEAPATIGRDEDCVVSLDEVWVSRQHCRIERRGNTFTLIDSGSHNGTLVNGHAIDEHDLEHGDRISLGAVVFAFLTLAGGGVVPELVDWDIDTPEANHRSTLQLPIPVGSAVKSMSAALAPPTDRSTARWSRLVELAQSLSSEGDHQRVQEEVSKALVALTPATRAGVFLGSELRTLEGQGSVNGDSDEGFRPPQSVVARVFDDRTAQLFVSQQELPKSESVTTHRLDSIACSPILSGKEILGVLYVDSSDPGSALEAQDLEILVLVSQLVSAALQNHERLASLDAENKRLRIEALAAETFDLVGESPSMVEVHAFIRKVAPTDSTVSILGESGTGKELVARALHRLSKRADKSFVTVDCTTLTESLLASELFGHEKGAFTGAVSQKRGKLELAHGGTVFLDEVGELPLELQSKLLRVLQERRFERVGGNKSIEVDIRLVTATNRNLSEEVSEGRFRQDLFYRIQVLEVNLPRLQDRGEDVVLLAEFFLSRLAPRASRRVTGFSDAATKMIRRHSWPGNVRELANAIERAVVLGDTETILPEDLPEYLSESPSSRERGSEIAGEYHELLTERKREIVLAAIAGAEGNITDAAKALNLHPNYLHRLIKNLGLRDQISNQ